MKIRKALEKAKLVRELGKTPSQEYMERVARQGEWTPPVYSESRYAEVDYKKMAENKCIALFPDSPYLDALKVLRTRINGLIQDKNCRTLMVTSAIPGEGKTLTSINLALTYAKEFNQTVLLMDCDFHRQDVHKYMGIESDKGLVDYLVRETPMKDLMIWPGVDKMTLISGGATVKESTELLESSRMRGLMDEIKNRYSDRFIIFDVPPVLTGADAIAFAGLVDSIIMVIEHGRTSINDVTKALELLPREKFLGFVLNRDRMPKDSYY